MNKVTRAFVALMALLLLSMTSLAANKDAKDQIPIQNGKDICQRVSHDPDCLKMPWKDFVVKYGKDLSEEEVARFRVAQLLSLNQHLDQLQEMATALDRENKEIATSFCSSLFKRFTLDEPFDVCRKYVADMIWDIRNSGGKRIAGYLKAREAEEAKQNVEKKAGLSALSDPKQVAIDEATNSEFIRKTVKKK